MNSNHLNAVPFKIKMEEAYNGDEESEDFTLTSIKEVEVFSCTNCPFESENIDELDEHIVKNHEIQEVEDSDEDFKAVCDEVSKKKTASSSCVSTSTFSGAVKKNGPQFGNSTNKSGNRSSKKRPAEFSQDDGGSRKKAKDSMLRCGWCNFLSQDKSEMKLHRQTHSKADPSTIYKCSQCQYQTKRKNDMPKHMLGHCTNVEMFHCPECSYKTKRKCDLPKHMLCHKPASAVPIYRCEFCNYVTKRKGDLPKHVLNHTEKSQLKSFQCVECNYRTRRANDLNKHILVHSDRHVEGVFKCLRCPYAADKLVRFAKHVQSRCQISEDSVNQDFMLEDILNNADQDGIHVVLNVEEDEDMQPQVGMGKYSYVEYPKVALGEGEQVNDNVITEEVVNVPGQVEGAEGYYDDYVIEEIYTNAETGEIIDPSLVEEVIFEEEIYSGYENEELSEEENQAAIVTKLQGYGMNTAVRSRFEGASRQ